jgi:TRAP-type uncharacterized transport system substrate-binding protein
MRYWCAALALVFTAVLAIAGGGGLQAAEAPRKRTLPSTVGVLSASSEPESIGVVNDLAAALNSDTLRILPVVGQGPVQNIDDLFHLKGADAALLPADVLRYLQRVQRLPGAEQSIRYIAAVGQEQVHILARREFTRISDLAGRKVSIGTRDSSAYVTGTVLFQELKISIEPVSLEPALALQALRRGEIAALVYPMKKPARLFFDLNLSDGVHFLPLPLTPELAQTYVPARLDPEDYPLLIGRGEAGRGAAVPTIGVPLLLAVRSASSGSERYRDLSRFVDALFLRASALQRLSRDSLWAGFDPTAEIRGWQRFEPAVARLRGNATVESGTSAPPTARGEFATPQQKEELFRQFLQRERAQRPKE